MQFAPSTYYAILSRTPSPRESNDEALKPEILRVHESNCDGVYGGKKVWKQLKREGINLAHCTVRRLMKAEGLTGARRGRQFKLTTISDENQYRPSDLVERQFTAAGTEPIVGGGPDVCEDPQRLGLRRLHRRCVLSLHRGLADLHLIT